MRTCFPTASRRTARPTARSICRTEGGGGERRESERPLRGLSVAKEFIPERAKPRDTTIKILPRNFIDRAGSRDSCTRHAIPDHPAECPDNRGTCPRHTERHTPMARKGDKGGRKDGSGEKRRKQRVWCTLASPVTRCIPLSASHRPPSLPRSAILSSSRCTHRRRDRGLLGSRSGTCAGQRRIRRWP